MAEEGAVQVCVRVRPANDREKSLQGGSAVDGPPIHWKADNQTISQISGTRSFSFDRVFHAEETTATLYNEIAHSIVRSIIQGYNGTIFAYGQTSSGKTYTMMGNAAAPGLIPLAICNLFRLINDTPNREFLLRVSYMEIYNESVSDLFAGPKRRPLEVREDMERIVYVAGLTEELAVTYEDVMKLVQKGEKNRHYGETKMNEHSSRSHTIFRLIVESRDITNEAIIVAHLNLVDLAGSERASQTGAEGVRLKEGCFINRSLFVLGQVIKKLSDGQAGGFLNYRDSKLTRILQNSLGGNARTLIICTITPVVFEETLSTLQFASTAKFMKNTPHVNEVLDDQAMLKRCHKEIMDLKNQLEELTSDNRVQAKEKAQLLSEKHMLQTEHEQKITNLTRMLVRVSTDEDQEMKARRKRRVTWAPGKLQASLDSSNKMKKLDKICQEQDEDDDFDADRDWLSKTISERSSTITTKRGGSCGFQVPPFEDFLFLNDHSRESPNCSSLVYDAPSKEELEQRISELEKQIETLTEEKESKKHKDYTSHVVKQLQLDAESSKLENDQQREEIKELKKLLKEQAENAKYFKMENEKQRKEIQELEKLRGRIEELKEKREIEEFEFLEKEAEKEEKAQQKHENATLRELIHNSEIVNQGLEAELKTKTDRLKEQEQNLLDLQQQLERFKEVLNGKVNLETLTVQIKQLQQSLNDAEVVTLDAKKEASFTRSENLELKEEMDKMRVTYQRMEKDVQLYSSQRDTERSRYKEMQCDLQRELNSAFNENTKLMSLMDGKVPKDLLDHIHLEKDIFDLKQRLEKTEKEKTSLQEEASLLSQYKSLPEKVDELAKQVLKLTEELNSVISERNDLLACREENVEHLENLRGEMLAIAQDRNKLQEMLATLQTEREHLEKLTTEQQNEMQCKVANLEKELDLYSTKLEEKTKCAQFQHNFEDEERQVKEQEQQLKQELQKQKEVEDKYSKASENLKLLNEEKEELVIKLQEETKAKAELTTSQSMPFHQGKDTLNVSIKAEATNQDMEREDLTEQKNQDSLNSEKEALHQELMNLRTENEQLKSDLQENIEMCIENQAELRDLQNKLKLNQNVELELKKSLAEIENLLSEEKEKTHKQTEELDLLLTEIEKLRAQVSEEHNSENREKFNQQLQQLEDEKSFLIKEKDDLQARLKNVEVQRNEMKDALQESSKKMQEQSEELHHVKSQRGVLITEIDELKTRVSNEQSTELLEEKFNLRLQQLEDEKLTIATEKDEQLESVKSQNSELMNTLQENTEAQTKEMHRVKSQRDVLLGEIEELRARVSNEQSTELLEEKFNLRLQQLEDEKLTIATEKDEQLESVKSQNSELMNTLQENTEAMQQQTKEMHRVKSQRDVLLGEIEELRARVSNEEKAEIQEKEFNEKFQQLEDEKSTVIKENENLQEMLQSVEVQRDEMKSTLQESTRVWTDEFNNIRNHRDQLLTKITQLKEELKTRVSKAQKMELLQRESSDQLEKEKISTLMEYDELKLQLEKTQKVLCEKAEMLKMEERLNKELKESVATLEEQIVTLNEERAQLVPTNSETDPVVAEINTVYNCLQEKDLLLQNAIQSLHELKNEYQISLSTADQELLRETEAWKELLIGFCTRVPEGSTESARIGKLQQENQQLHEKLVVLRNDFMRMLNNVPARVRKCHERFHVCDAKLAEYKKKNEELLLQLHTLKKQVSDPAEQELMSEEKNAEIIAISALIATKENHLQNVQKNLLELKSKYPNFLTSAQNELLSRTKARKYLMERISNQSCTNILEIIEEIENENQMLDQQYQLQRKAVLSEADFSRSMIFGFSAYLCKTCEEADEVNKRTEELLLEIKALRRDAFNQNGYDPLLTIENQKLSKKLKSAELLLQKMRIKNHDLEMTLTASRETYKQQEDKLSELQTELSSKTLDEKLENLQMTLLKKDRQIKTFEESLKQLQAKLDRGAQPFKEEMTELKNQLFALQMAKIKESKHFENQISSLEASLEHKEEQLREIKATLRRTQQELDTTIAIESKDEKHSTDAPLSYSAGSGIVQNAMVLVLNSEKAKLNRDLNQLKKENTHLTRMLTDLKYENNKWKERAVKYEEKDRTPVKHRLKHENVQHTLTLCPDESLTSLSQRERTPIPQKVKISTALFSPENKTTDTRDETAPASETTLPIDSSRTSLFDMKSQPWLLPHSKIFDNSQLGFLAAGSPQQKPKPDENALNWWPEPSAAEPECKMQ
ncbi:centromere-associated protein E [Mustelus asterias]